MLELTEIDGRKASVAYLTARFEPCAKEKAALLKVVFQDNLDVAILTPKRKQ